MVSDIFQKFSWPSQIKSGTTIPVQFQASLMYLRIKLDRSLTFRQHLEALSMLPLYVVLSIQPGVLRIFTQALVFFATEYCALVWCRRSHIKKLNTILNNALRAISDCLRATPLNQIDNISPSTLWRDSIVLALSQKTTTTRTVVRSPSPDYHRDLKTGSPKVTTAIFKNSCVQHQWIVPKISGQSSMDRRMKSSSPSRLH